MNKAVLAFGLALTLGLLVLLRSGFGKDTRHVESPLVGRQAPPFSLLTVDGKSTVTLDSLKGRPSVVNFWATWCQPCKSEHAVLQQAARNDSADARFVGVVYEDEPEHINEFLNNYGGSTYPTLVDVAGKTAIAYGVSGVPETFFIDPNGHIVSKYEGAIPLEILQSRIAELQGSKR